MKKFTLIALLFCSFTMLFAQAPQKMSYQSVIRKTDGALVVNTLVGIKISILQGAANGTAVYVETQSTTTNANGLATLAIGGGTPVAGTFAGINWASGTYFIKTETDPIGGTNYTISGTSQLLSVPYALYAGSSQGKTSIVLTGNITDAQAASKIAAEFGPYTENIYIQNTTGLTTVDLSTITSLIHLSVSYNANLTTVNFGDLTAIFDYCNINDNKVLSTLSFPALSITPSSSGEFSIYQNPALSSISFPLLATISEFRINDNPIITSINLPMLTSGSYLGIENNLSLTFVGIPLLNNCKAINFYRNALPNSQINALLNKFLTITPGTGKEIGLSGQTPPAPPTGQGIIDKATLINAGNNVFTD